MTPWLRSSSIGLLPGLTICLTGCSIFNSTLESNHEFAVPKDETAACAFAWPSVIEDRRWGWVAMPDGSGMRFNLPPNEDVFGPRTATTLLATITTEADGICPGKPSSEQDAAQVVMHYAGYTNIMPGAVRIPVGTILIAASLVTLGFSPMVGTNSYAICVDVSGADGSRRTGFSQGKIRTVVNMGGEKRLTEASGGLVNQMLDQLAVEAWHMAWVVQPSGADVTPDCEVAMKAFMQGCYAYCN